MPKFLAQNAYDLVNPYAITVYDNLRAAKDGFGDWNAFRCLVVFKWGKGVYPNGDDLGGSRTILEDLFENIEKHFAIYWYSTCSLNPVVLDFLDGPRKTRNLCAARTLALE